MQRKCSVLTFLRLQSSLSAFGHYVRSRVVPKNLLLDVMSCLCDDKMSLDYILCYSRFRKIYAQFGNHRCHLTLAWAVGYRGGYDQGRFCVDELGREQYLLPRQ